MNREYHKWYSPSLGRNMEMLLYGHGGAPLLVFPSSMGRFYEYEDRGMISTIAGRYENGEIQASWDCLRRVGNLSSASVLCVLEDVMLNRRPEPGTLGVMAALGPGFCSEVVLLRW